MRRNKTEQDEINDRIRDIFNDNPNAKYSDIHRVVSVSDKTISRIKKELGLSYTPPNRNPPKKLDQKPQPTTEYHRRHAPIPPNPQYSDFPPIYTGPLDTYIRPTGEEMWFLMRCIRNEVIKHPKYKHTATELLRKICGLKKIDIGGKEG